jgi:hypothetical protein
VLSRRRLPILLLVFAAVRLLQAASATETETFDFEEGYTLTAAWELLHHRVWPIAAYQHSDWEGGSLVMVLLTAPFCWLLGPSLFALKAAALCVSCVAFVGLYALARTAYGTRTATLACGLFLLSTDPILSYGLTAKGFHPDSVALQLLFLYGVVVSSEGDPPRRRLFWLGALAGFGTYFAYAFALTPLACALVWIRQPRAAWRRTDVRTRLVPLLAGLLLGAAPLVAFNIRYRFTGLAIHGRSPLSFISPFGFAEKLRHFALDSTAALTRFAVPEGMDPNGYGVYVVAFWLAALGALVLPRHGRTAQTHSSGEPARFLDRVVVVYTVLYFSVAILSRYTLESYHLVPLLVMLLLRISDRLVWLWERGPGGLRLLAVTLMAPLAAVGFVANAGLVHPERLGASLLLDARDYLQFCVRVTKASPERSVTPRFAALRASLPPEFGDGAPVFSRFFRTAPADLLTGATTAQRTRDERFLVGYGLALWHRDHSSRSGHLLVGSYLDGLELAAMEPMLQGYGYALCPPDACLALDWSIGIPPEGQERVAFGLGRSIPFSRFVDSDGRYALDRLPARLHPAFMMGLGYELGLRSLQSLPSRIARRIPAPHRPAFWSGVAEGVAARAIAPPVLQIR